MSRSTESLTSAKMAAVPPTMAVVPAGAAAWAASRTGPRTTFIADSVYGASASATSIRAPLRSAVSTG